MAFLCPVRIRRSKKKKHGETMDDIRVGLGNSSTSGPPLGRITGSASIETLVRVGLEKEHGLSPDSKMVVLHDFTPCVDDELEVKRGSIVNVLYQENDWVYVIGEANGGEGFIPHSYCAPFGSPMAELALNVKHKKIPRADPNQSVASEAHHQLNTTIGTLNQSMPVPGQENSDNESYLGGANKQGKVNESQCSLQSGGSSQPDAHPFFKDPSGRFIVLYTFIARDENDVSVERGEFVTVLNREDPDWYWIVRSDGQEGFIPSAFVYPAELVIGDLRNNQQPQQPQPPSQQPQQSRSSTTYSNQGAIAAGLAAAMAQAHHNQHQHHQQQHAGGGMDSGSRNNESMNQSFSSPVGATMGMGSPGGASGGGAVSGASDAEVARCQGTELVMLYDYKAQAPDDLSVRRGDWVYADLNNQTVDGWLWAYAPKTRKYGFIPKAYARPPAMTSL